MNKRKEAVLSTKNYYIANNNKTSNQFNSAMDSTFKLVIINFIKGLLGYL